MTADGALIEAVNELEGVPLPLGEGGAKRRVRVEVAANPVTLTQPSPKGRGIYYSN